METKEIKQGATCDCNHNNCNCGAGSCNCGGSQWGGHHKHFLLRVVLGIIILIVVFQLGVMVGRIEGQMQAYGFFDRGDHMMRGGDFRMMRFDVAQPAVTVTPVR